MEVTDEEFGGTLVTLGPGDRLKSVPRSHRRLVTPQVETWWADPLRAARGIADRAVTPNMGRWFRQMADGGGWRLELHKAPDGAGRAGFWLSCPGVRGAEVGPPATRPVGKHLSPGLADYYRLVGYMDWMGFGAAGGLDGPDGHAPLSAFAFDYHGADVDPARAFVFGWSPCGDMIIYTADGRGGWLNHGSHEIRLLGSVLDTIDWVYGELLADRCPDYFVVR
jgi:hypothetical protein